MSQTITPLSDQELRDIIIDLQNQIYRLQSQVESLQGRSGGRGSM